MNILVMGAGAVGSVFGGFLAKAGHRVFLVGREGHMTAIRERGLLINGIWGEHLSLKKEKDKAFSPVPYANSTGPWQQFLRVRAGKAENPCPPEVGLRFARLMDMIRTSAETGATVRAG